MIEELVTTIIPVYNRPTLLVRAANSVLAQSYRPIEIIIVDDGSTDETGKVADDLVRANPDVIRVVRQRNSGPGSAREAGRRIARGGFIQYLDSDDWLLPDKFKLQVEGLHTNSDCGVSYGKTRHHQLPTDVAWKATGFRLAFMFPAFLKERCWSTPTPLYRRTLLDQAGPWSELSQEEDWEYDCRIAALGVRLHFCDSFIAEIGSDEGNSLSSGWQIDDRLMKDRAKAHALIYEHATKARIHPEQPEMQHFSRELFLLSRQCGALGLQDEARLMFQLSRQASGARRSGGWDYKVYGFAARMLGWEIPGRAACCLDRLRS